MDMPIQYGYIQIVLFVVISVLVTYRTFEVSLLKENFPNTKKQIYLSKVFKNKIITIPHLTRQTNLSQEFDNVTRRWNLSNRHLTGITIANVRNEKSTTIEGNNGTGDTNIGGSDLKIAITANQTDTDHIQDNCNTRGGGGGDVSVGCDSQSPPTPTVGKTLLNTSANLLPITTASDTFNNLKNLVKIDKGLPSTSGTTSNNGSYRTKSSGGGYKSGTPHLGSPTTGEGRNITIAPIGSRSGASGASGHFSAGFNKNSVKIRQHDSDVSPRPRRSYQGDSSSSRYYNKNSDTLGQGSKIGSGGNSTFNNGRPLVGESIGRGHLNSENRRAYQITDGGGYNRNLNSAPGPNYRHQQSTRYENGSGNGQNRQYGNTNSGYNNHNKASYGHRGLNESNVNSRQSYREDYGNNYRDYDDSPRSRYTSSNNTNDLEHTNNGRYRQQAETTGLTLPTSNFRQSGNQNEAFEHSVYENRAQLNRTPPVRGGALPSAPSSSVNLTSSSCRGISPNSVNNPTGIQQPTPAPTPPPVAGRWVPPSLRPQHGLTQTEKNDAVFRKVRGILNKLTPEKFQELSDDLLKLDLNSIVILNGVILLIFDKALDEPKYSSMYAQLCKRLSEEAPSFEKDTNSSCTFLRLLIAVCRDKFNNRLKRDSAENDNNNQFNKVHKPQANSDNDADEDERRHLAKQRMLGNVKFIGELNKLDMLSTNVLHQCIMELLDKKTKRSATPQEMCEDMECLAQLLKTCGKNLDSEQGKELMNQYFETLERRSKSVDYPPRIRFMLKDVIELRENNWVPRKVATTDGPVPIKQIRTDDDAIIRTPFVNRNRDMRNNDRDGDSWMNRFHLNLQPGFNDMFGSLSVTGSSPMMSTFTNNSNNNNRPYMNRERNNQNNNYNNRFNKHNNQNGSGNNREDMRNASHLNREQANTQFGGNQMINNKELAPRFKRNLITTNQDSVENLQMRPAANSLLFKAASQNQKLPTMLPISTPLTIGISSNNSLTLNKGQLSNLQYPLLGTPTSHLNNPVRPSSTPSAEYDGKGGVQSSIPIGIDKGLKATSSSPNFIIPSSLSDKQNGSECVEVNSSDTVAKKTTVSQQVTKHGSVEHALLSAASSGVKQQKKEKSFNKEEVLKKAGTYFKENFFYEDNDANTTDDVAHLDKFVNGLIELKVPEKCIKDVCINMIMDVLDKNEDKYLDRIMSLLQVLRKQSYIKANILLDIFKQVVNRMNEREVFNPRIATHVAGLLCKAVTSSDTPLVKLSDIANFTDNGQHYPLFLLVLQQLHKTSGKGFLEEVFRASKIDLMNSLPEVDRNKPRLAEILDDRNLTFLYPLLKVQAEMFKQLSADPNAAAFYKWIKTNVDPKYYKDPGFINALMTVLLKLITQETSLADGIDIKKHPDKPIIEKEGNLLLKYCQLLQTFLGESNELQLIALYALQVFCFNENFPKGMLCRWFKYLFESDVIEEDTFIQWKEEISDKYPGKGAALFQVNNWLTWLQEAESEDDED